MKQHTRTRKIILTAILMLSMILMLAIIAKCSTPKTDPYLSHEAKTASLTARNSVVVNKYLPATIQWHMSSQAKIDGHYQENGTMDYGCDPQTRGFITTYDCAAKNIKYKLYYTPQGQIMNFEWDYTGTEV